MVRTPTVLMLCLALSACGARSSLEGVDAGGGSSIDGGVSRDAGPRRDGGRPDGLDAGPLFDAGRDAGPDAGPDRCTLEPRGEPTLVYRRGAHGEGLSQPTPIALDADRFALAMQHEHFWHPDVRVAELTLTGDQIEETQPMVRWGIDAHSFHVVTRGPGARLGMSHFQGDLAAGRPQGTVYVPLDLSAWSVGEPQFLGDSASFSYSLTASGGGSFVTYLERDDGTRVLWLARLDESGAPAGEPMLLGESREGPFGAFTDVAADGAVLVAQNSGEGTRFGRVDWAARAYEERSLVAPIEGRTPRSPTLRTSGDEAWAIWREEVAGSPEEEYVVRLARLGPGGELLELAFEAQVPIAQGPGLVVGEASGVAMLALPGDPNVMAGEPGASVLRLVRVRDDGDVQTIDLPTTRLHYSRAHEAAWLPGRRLVVSYAAFDAESSMNAIYVALYECAPDP